MSGTLFQSQSIGVSYRHDPYSFNPFVITESAAPAKAAAAPVTAARSPSPNPITAASAVRPLADRVLSSAGFALPIPASVAAKAKAKALLIDAVTHNDDGVSEVSSECDARNARDAFVNSISPLSATLSVEAAATPAPAAANPPVIRYTSVNFRFGSAWFLAPFRTFVGDMVVVQYPSNGSTHMGLVSSITTVKPTTFYSEDNTDPNYLSADDLAVLPRLLRHARDFDREAKLDLRSHDLRSLASAQALAEEMGAPVTFLDAEWLLDLSAVTFLVNVYGKATLVDRLADELAAQEGAEVVFTYPATTC